MRTPALLLGLALAGCAGADAGNPLALSPEPAAAAPASSVARAAQAAAKQPDKEEWWRDGGVTRDKINAMCWMKYENGRNDLPVDRRADLVNACVAQALKEHPIR